MRQYIMGGWAFFLSSVRGKGKISMFQMRGTALIYIGASLLKMHLKDCDIPLVEVAPPKNALVPD